MKFIYENLNKTAFWICLCIAVCLMVGSFFCPPMGVIDGSILAGVGELFGFAALATIIEAIGKGVDAKITKGDVSIELSKEDEELN